VQHSDFLVYENGLLEINVCSNGLLLIIPFHAGAISNNISVKYYGL